jgi:hypothetical protein
VRGIKLYSRRCGMKYKVLTVKYRDDEEFAVLVDLLKEYSKELGIPMKTLVYWAIRNLIENGVAVTYPEGGKDETNTERPEKR